MTFRAPVCVPVWIEFSKVTSLTGTRVCASTRSRVFPRVFSPRNRARSFLSPSLSLSFSLSPSPRRSVASGRSVVRSFVPLPFPTRIGIVVIVSHGRSWPTSTFLPQLRGTELLPSSGYEVRTRILSRRIFSPPAPRSRAAARPVPSVPSTPVTSEVRRSRARTLALAHLPDIYVAPVASVREMRFAQRSSD